MMQRFAEGVDLSDSGQALSAIREVGPDGHFFGATHTQSRYETAFYAPFLSDWSNFENWRDSGSVDTTQRANQIYHNTIRNYERPPISDAAMEEIDAFIARRESEGGADIER